MLNKVNRGSEWRKWDLHLHSIYSNLKGCGDYNGVTEEEFIEKIKQEKIEAIGLTNYINFNEKDFELADKLRKNGIIVFHNLELRLTSINDGDQLADYHIIFSDELSSAKIKEILGKLDVKVGSSEKTALAISDKSDYERAAVEFDHLHKTLSSESLNIKGKYMTAFLSRGHGHSICGKERKFTVYENITRNSDIIIHSSTLHENLEIDRNYWLGKASNSSSYIRPLLQTSDAHQLDQIGYKRNIVEAKHKDKRGVIFDGSNYYSEVPGFTWIKSDLTFEGLKQIIYEPEERICYGRNHPDNKADYLVIDYIEYENGRKIYLNSGLNAIIGGRSTGKSTLLNSIARSLNNSNFKPDTPNVFEKDVKVVWKDGLDGGDKDIEFIPQEFMVELSMDKVKYNDLLREIIRKKGLESEEGKYLQDVSEIRSRINQLLYTHSEALNRKRVIIKPEGDKQGIEKSLSDLEEKINFIRERSNFTEEDNKNYKNVLEEIEELEKVSLTKVKEINELESLKSIQFNSNVNLYTLNNDTRSILEQVLNDIKEYADKKWNETVVALIQETGASLSQVKNQIDEKRKSVIYLKGKNLEKQNEELSSLESRKEYDKKALTAIYEYLTQVEEIDKIIKENENNIVKEFIKLRTLIRDLEMSFEIEKHDLMIQIRVKVNEVEEKINYINARGNAKSKFIEEFRNKMDIGSDESLKEFLINIFTSKDLAFNGGASKEAFIRDIFSNNWFDYDYILTYKGDEFDKMSQGKKSFVILKLLLEFSDNKKPVLIDQPEDSLDNRAIYHELRKYIVDTKKERQMIIVTHNPNVVIGSDAENVIVANQHNNLERNNEGIRFQYVNGSLENTRKKDPENKVILDSQGIREHIFDILEGGEEAFAKREKKYNLKR